VQGAQLVHFGALHRELRVNRFHPDREPLLLHLMAVGKFLGRGDADLGLQRSQQAQFAQGFVGIRFQPGLFVLGLDLGHFRLLVEAVASQPYLEIGVLRFRGLYLIFSVQRRQLHLRIPQHHEHRVPAHRCPGTNQNRFDAPIRRSGNPQDLFGNQRSKTAHLPHHGASFHGVAPDRRALYGRRGRLQAARPEPNH